MSKMITVRMPDDRVAQIDALVATGSHASRASVVIAALDRFVSELEEREVDRAIVEGYTRVPPTGDEARWADLSTTDSIREEPW